MIALPPSKLHFATMLTTYTVHICLHVKVLLRQGGVREPAFQVPYPVFWLMPTAFHINEAVLKPNAAQPYHTKSLQWDPKAADTIPIKAAAKVRCHSHFWPIAQHAVHGMDSLRSVLPWLASNDVVAVLQVASSFVTDDHMVFDALDSLHQWTPEFKQQRLSRSGTSITAMLLRTYELSPPHSVPQDGQYWGCFSWGACCHAAASIAGLVKASTLTVLPDGCLFTL